MMNKLTKLLSVFVLAGAIGTGAGALAGCAHKHTFSSEWKTDATQHWHEATCDHTDEKSDIGNHVDADNDGKCDVCKYDMKVAVPATGITLSQTSATLKVDESVKLTATVTPADSTDTVSWDTSDPTVAVVAGGTVKAIAPGTATITAKAGSFTATCDIQVIAYTEISTAEQLLELRQQPELTGVYKLTANIDLEGETLTAPQAVLAEGATFDGQGYTISNAVYTEAGAKEGILFKTINGGTVTNIKFLGCSISSANESVGILAGECNATCTISKIEFNSCSAKTTNTYVGLLFARKEGSGAATITMSEITAKNGCTTSCSEYGGFLVGDITGDTTVVFKDLDIDGEFKGSSGNGSFIAGRTRSGATVSVENAVISAQLPVPIATSTGIFSGNGDCTKLTIKNVLIVKSNVSNLYQSTKAPKAKDIQNLVTVEGVTVDEATATDGADTAAYLKTLGFDFTDVWMEEGTSGYRLKAASTNVKSEGAVIKSVKVNIGNVKTRFKKGETFDSTGISVTGVYSDGVQLVLGDDEYEVVSTDVDLSRKGTYKVHVMSKEDAKVSVDYEVTVVEETGFKVYSEFVPKVYVVGGKVDYKNLVVVSVWSDNVEEKLEEGAGGYTLNSNGAPDLAAAGEKSIRVDYGSYEGVTFNINVVAKATVDEATNTVTVNVDAAATAVTGTTFKTVADAIDFLEACEFDKDVIKVVNVAAGTYTAKITTDLCNLTLVGANTGKADDKSILTYSAVESTVDIVSGKAYGLDCATLKVTGENFTAKNITIRNDFNYIRDSKKESSPQGLALTVAGDKAELVGVHLYGNQDTLYLKNGRAYFKDCLIEGNIDFIFGEATGIAFFDECEIKAITKSENKENNNGYVTAMKADDTTKPDYGYVFSNCNFTDDGKLADGSMSLGRPWGKKATVAYISCTFSKAYSTLAYDGKAKSRWFDMSGNKPEDADFVEYDSKGDGKITEAVAGGSILTAAEAANYTMANVFAMENGKCKWTTPWAGTNTKVAITIKNGDDQVIYSGAVEKGVTISEDIVKEWLSAGKKELKGLFTDKACQTAYNYSTVINEAKELYATYDEVHSTTYTYNYVSGKYTAEDPWSSNCTTNTKSEDSTKVEGLKVEATTALTLKATGTKATISVTGFTSGSSKASAYLDVIFLDAEGNEIGKIVGTTTENKLNGAYTFTNNVFEAPSGKEFASIKFTCNTSGKSCGIVSVTIDVE